MSWRHCIGSGIAARRCLKFVSNAMVAGHKKSREGKSNKKDGSHHSVLKLPSSGGEDAASRPNKAEKMMKAQVAGGLHLLCRGSLPRARQQWDWHIAGLS